MASLLLIHPASEDRTLPVSPPLGMAWIASYCRSVGIDTCLVDLHVSDQDIEDLLEAHGPLVVGIGGTTQTRFESFRLAREVKRWDPGALVLYGGPHATFTAEDTLTGVPAIDVVVRGEGEVTAAEIVDRLSEGQRDLTGVAGASFRRDGEIVHNPDRPRLGDLDMLPMPERVPELARAYDMPMEFLDLRGTAVITSRGCPVNCSFCSASALFGTGIHMRDPRSVVDEVETLLKEHGYEAIKFFDSTFTMVPHHARAICEEIIRRGLDFPWECEIRVGSVSRDLLSLMRKSGCYYVSFGVESASPRVLKRMHKKIRIQDASALLSWTREIGLRTKVFFTFGHIEETYDDALLTVRFMEQHRKLIDHVAIALGIMIYPGTEVERHARAIGCLPSDFNWSLEWEDPRAESLGVDSRIPILIQPGMGWRELHRTGRRLLLFWAKSPAAAWKAARREISLGNAGRFLSVPGRAISMMLTRYSRGA